MRERAGAAAPGWKPRWSGSSRRPSRLAAYFEADARRYGYVHQVAFYQAVLSQVIGLAMPVHFVAVEKKQPFRTGVWKVHEEVLAQARRENEAAIGRLRECMATDIWPSGYEECRLVDSL